MGAAATIPTFLPLIVVAAMRRAEQRIHRRFADASAFTAGSAIPFAPSRAFERRRFEHLLRSGAVQRTADGRYYLDSAGWDRHVEQRRRRVLLAASVAIALIGIAVAILLATR